MVQELLPLEHNFLVICKHTFEPPRKKARINQREEQVANRELLNEQEDELYGPGIAD